jgi:hypothetical protein
MNPLLDKNEPRDCPACWGRGHTYDKFDDERPCGVCAETGKVLPYCLPSAGTSVEAQLDRVIASHETYENAYRAFRDLAVWGKTEYKPISDEDRELALSCYRLGHGSPISTGEFTKHPRCANGCETARKWGTKPCEGFCEWLPQKTASPIDAGAFVKTLEEVTLAIDDIETRDGGEPKRDLHILDRIRLLSMNGSLVNAALSGDRNAVIEECRQAIKDMYQTSDRSRDLIEVTRILDTLRIWMGSSAAARKASVYVEAQPSSTDARLPDGSRITHRWSGPYHDRLEYLLDGRALTLEEVKGMLHFAAVTSAVSAKGEQFKSLDEARMDWLEEMHVEVRVPLVHGSRALFHASPEQGDGEELPSNIRRQIDEARDSLAASTDDGSVKP